MVADDRALIKESKPASVLSSKRLVRECAIGGVIILTRGAVDAKNDSRERVRTLKFKPATPALDCLRQTVAEISKVTSARTLMPVSNNSDDSFGIFGTLETVEDDRRNSKLTPKLLIPCLKIESFAKGTHTWDEVCVGNPTGTEDNSCCTQVLKTLPK